VLPPAVVRSPPSLPAGPGGLSADDPDRLHESGV